MEGTFTSSALRKMVSLVAATVSSVSTNQGRHTTESIIARAQQFEAYLRGDVQR